MHSFKEPGSQECTIEQEPDFQKTLVCTTQASFIQL